ncbi:MAG: efflux RND transporter permease subunit [Leptospira sp.]|nr:efflux RND transporter permease subunit [Leptospira sp.]
MILKITEKILKNRIGSLMFFFGVSIFGFLSIFEIPLSLLPNLDFPQLLIVTSFPNASPEEIDNIISRPIQQLVGTIQGVEKTESNSMEGKSKVHLRFKSETDMKFSLLEVREKLDLIRDALPSEASKPMISKFDPTATPFIQIIYYSKGLNDPKKLKSWVNEYIKMYFERIEGIALVELNGGYEKEVFVEIDPDRMNAYRIQPMELESLINSNNKNYPAGQLPFGNKELPVRMIGEYDSVFDIGKMIVKGFENNGYISLESFSEINERYKERNSLAKYNGMDAVVLSLYKEPGKNTIKLSREVSLVCKNVNNLFSKEIHGEIINDEAKFISDSLRGLFFSLILGAFLAFLSLLLILKNYQSPMVLILAIPATLLPSFLIFDYIDIGFNMMSLGGLALGIGMLFDSSNVVLSAIERHRMLGKDLFISISNGVQEVFSSVFAATATTVIVFLPIGFIKSSLGMIFREMALSIVITLSLSFIVSLTFIPLITSYFYKFRNDKARKNILFNIFNEEKLLRIYQKKLKFIYEYKLLFLKIILILFLTSLTLFFFIEKEYIPRIDTGEINIKIRLPTGTSLQLLNKYAEHIESLPEIKSNINSILTMVGAEEDFLIHKSSSEEFSQLNVKVSLKEEIGISSFNFSIKLKEILKNTDLVTYLIEPKENMLGELLSEKSAEISYFIIGEEENVLNEFSKNLKDKIYKINGVRMIFLGNEEEKPEYQIKYDAYKLAKYGLTNVYISTFIKIALKGIKVSEIKEGGISLPIRIGMKKNSSDTIEKIKSLRIVTPFGENVPLEQFVSFQKKNIRSNIIRHGNTQVNPIQIFIDPKTPDSKNQILDLLNKTQLPEGIKIKDSSEKEKLTESLNEMAIAFSLALLLIFMLLAGLSQSYISSFLMLTTVPLVFIGTFPALFITGKSLNISSFMGFILLMGVVVDNAALYYEYFNLYLKEIGDIEKAMFAAASTIFRPVIMNNTTTILGMFPIIFSISKGSEFQIPLGIVVISGLITSTVLSLFVIPLVFSFKDINLNG